MYAAGDFDGLGAWTDYILPALYAPGPTAYYAASQAVGPTRAAMIVAAPGPAVAGAVYGAAMGVTAKAAGDVTRNVANKIKDATNFELPKLDGKTTWIGVGIVVVVLALIVRRAR